MRGALAVLAIAHLAALTSSAGASGEISEYERIAVQRRTKKHDGDVNPPTSAIKFAGKVLAGKGTLRQDEWH